MLNSASMTLSSPAQVPLEANQIAPRLFVGSRPPKGHALRANGIDVLVLCAQEHQPRSINFPGVFVVHAPFDDAELDGRTYELAKAAGRRVTQLVRRGATVLVTCIEGRNRSAFVAGLALCELTGMRGDMAVRTIRRARRLPNGGVALTNNDFARALASR